MLEQMPVGGAELTPFGVIYLIDAPPDWLPCPGVKTFCFVPLVHLLFVKSLVREALHIA
jgi:hypothetical protein